MALDYQPTLRGSLVEARPLRRGDAADLYSVAADPLIWEQHSDKTHHEEAGFAEFFRDSLASGGALLVTDVESQRAIGSSRFFGYSAARSEVEIGWTVLARSHWGGAYNGELKRLMLRHAFEFVDSVAFFVSPENIRSQRAVRKVGAVLTEDPDTAGRLVYRITAAAFRAGESNMEASRERSRSGEAT